MNSCVSLRIWFVLCVVLCVPCAIRAEAPHAGGDVPVLMLSDIHFDPFRDPAKAEKLRAADISAWEAILSAPDSANATADFRKLQSTCNASKAVDTDWQLFVSSLKAEKAKLARPFFITISGDLMVHQFDCRFHTTGGANDAAAYTSFAEKVIAFVTMEVRHTFPGVPVYIALGNNDSGCMDYHEDAHSHFLEQDGLVAADAADQRHDREAIARGFSAQGDYAVMLPRPMQRTRLIVLQDIFESSHYKTCKGDSDTKQAEAQISWLRGQLASAREHHEQAWVMAHIPPGVDPYATIVTQHRDVCTGAAPVTFLSSNALGEAIDAYADVVKLAIFAHTHMDELRLFRGPHGQFAPGKLVPSISPVNGNHPAFTVAEVDPATATIRDFSVTVSSDITGASWADSYRYSAAYGEKDFSGASVDQLTAAMTKGGPQADAYRKNYSAGDKGMRALALTLVWPAYECSIAHDGPDDYKQCACGAAAPPAKP